MIAVASVGLSCLSLGAAAAQIRGNAQSDQSRSLLARGGVSISAPPVGRYAAETGEAFTLDRSGRQALLRFENRDETWVLRPSPAPRGDVIYRNDAGDQVLRVTASGGLTVFTSRAPGGSPASFSGSASALTPPTLGPVQLWQLMARRSALLTQATGRLVTIDLDGDRSEALCVEALIVTTDTVMRLLRSPSTRANLNSLRSIVITEGSRSRATFSRGVLTIEVDPSQGSAGRPSSARVIRALVP